MLKKPMTSLHACPYLQVDSLAATRDAGIHRAIKHEHLCAFWRCWFKDKEEVLWKTWWKRFPEELLETSPELGEDAVRSLEAFLEEPGARPAFQVSCGLHFISCLTPTATQLNLPYDRWIQVAVEKEDPETVSVDEIRARFPRGSDLVSTVRDLIKKGAMACQGSTTTEPPQSLSRSARPLDFSLPEVDALYVPRDKCYMEGLTLQLANGKDCICLVGEAGLGKSNMALDMGRDLWRRGLIPGGGVLVDLRLAITRSDIEGRFCAALRVDKVRVDKVDKDEIAPRFSDRC
jgi:hypothetical protein